MDEERLCTAIKDLADLMARLRGPGGCPWDAQQTEATLKTYLLEEAYEVVEAVERASAREVCGELGDLLFQILFMSRLAAERGEFDFIDVIERIRDKMIYRHPHVFGHVKVEDAREVADNWEALKKRENGERLDTSDLLRSVPAGLPALMRTHRLMERASKAHRRWRRDDRAEEDSRDAWDALGGAVASGDRELVGERMGELLFGLVNLSRRFRLNAEDLLREANARFLDRFEQMEQTLTSHGIRIDEASPEQLDEAWDAAGTPRAR